MRLSGGFTRRCIFLMALRVSQDLQPVDEDEPEASFLPDASCCHEIV